MTKISIYNIDEKVTGGDKWIGSDVDNSSRTKNFTPTKLAKYFNDEQIVNIGTPIQYTYYTVDITESRPPRTLTFETEIGSVVPFSTVTTFLLSKYTTKWNDVSNYLPLLIGTRSIIYRSNNINQFGLYTINTVEPYLDDPNFFEVTVTYMTGNGSLEEDKDYMISLIDFSDGDIPTKTSELINDGEDGIHPFITLGDIPAFTGTLNNVLTNGNTSLLDAKVGTLGLWDTINSYYNKLGTLGNTFYYQLNSGANIFTVSSSSLNLNNGTATLEIINPITATRTLYWPDATGTIALTTDIPGALTFTSPLVDTLGTITIDQSNTTTDGYLSSTDWNIFNGKQDVITLTTTGTSGAATFIANTLNIPNYSTDLSGYVPTSRTLTINGTLYDLTTDRSWSVGTVTSVGLSMPPAFTVSSSPITGTGTIAVTGAGTSSQYIRGDGQLATMPSGGGGGSSVNYYLNGSIAASVATYKQLSNTAIIGGGTDFSLTGNGLITQFLTDVGNPNRIEIPGGAWNFEMWFSMSSNGGTPRFYVELLKYNGTTFTTIANSSAVPETINGGTTIDLYLTSLAVPTTVLLSTDRLAIRVYIVNNSGGRTATLHTENSHLCEIITTFSGGVTSLNGLTANTQYLAVGTTGTDFNISSVSETHTFNLPTASATNRGALSTTDWTAFNGKFTLPALTSGSVLFSNGTTIAQDNANFFFDDTNNRLGIGTNVPSSSFDLIGNQLITFADIINMDNGVAAFNIKNNTFSKFNIVYDATQIRLNIFGTTTQGLRIQSGSNTNISTVGGGGMTLTSPGNNFTINGGSLFFNVNNTTLMKIVSTGNILVGTTTDNGGKLQIKAGGALSTDIALRVRNSADTADLMTVNGVGTSVTIGSSTDFYVNSNDTLTGVGRFAIVNASGSSGPVGYLIRAAGVGEVGRLVTSTASGNLIIQNSWSPYGMEFNTSGANTRMFISGGLGNIGIGTTTPVASAKLQVESTTQGFLPPRMTTTQRDAIATPATGLQVYNTTLGTQDFYNGTSWNRFGTQTLIRAGGALSTDIALRVRNSADSADLTFINGLGYLYANGIYTNTNSQIIGMLTNSYGSFQGSANSGYLEITETANNKIRLNTGTLVFNATTVLVGTTTSIASSKLTIESTTQGFLPPRMTSTQRNAIATPATGLIVYDSTLLSLYQYNGTSWKPLLSSVGISNLTATGTADSTTFLRGDNVWDKNFRWFDYVLGKTTVTETAVSGGVVQEFSYAGTTEKRYRFIGSPYDAATDIIYTTFSAGVLSNPIAYKLITL